MSHLGSTDEEVLANISSILDPVLTALKSRPHLRDHVLQLILRNTPVEHHGPTLPAKASPSQDRPDSCQSLLRPDTSTSFRTSMDYPPSVYSSDSQLPTFPHSTDTVNPSCLTTPANSVGNHRPGHRVPRESDSITDERRFFCTFCYEQGSENKTFGIKADWKRHERDFHESGVEYTCPSPGCGELFSRDRDLKKHFHNDHADREYPGVRDVDTTTLAQKKIYGCGFCGKVIKPKNRNAGNAWNDRCDHVAQCMMDRVKDGFEWTFSKTILSLLKSPSYISMWRDVRSLWCKKFSIEPAQLEWYLETCKNLRRDLEQNEVGPSLKVFLENAFRLGILGPDDAVEGRWRYLFVETNAQPCPQPTHTVDEGHYPGANGLPDLNLGPTFPTFDHFDFAQYAPEAPSHMDDPMGLKRQSVVMEDAPALGQEFGLFNDNGMSGAATAAPLYPHPPMSLDVDSFSFTVAHSAEAAEAQNHNLNTPVKRKLSTRFKTGFSSKKQDHPLDHPDLPLNLRRSVGGRLRHSQGDNVQHLRLHNHFES